MANEHEDVERWLNKLGLILTALDIDHNSGVASVTLAFYLAGSGEIWYSGLPEATRLNVSLSKDALIERFASTDLIHLCIRAYSLKHIVFTKELEH